MMRKAEATSVCCGMFYESRNAQRHLWPTGEQRPKYLVGGRLESVFVGFNNER